jgi:hypothetical protein
LALELQFLKLFGEDHACRHGDHKVTLSMRPKTTLAMAGPGQLLRPQPTKQGGTSQ